VSAAVFLGVLFGIGALLVLTAQPHGAARPSLSARLEYLRPDRPAATVQTKAPVFRTFLLEQLFRPFLEKAGDGALRLARVARLDLRQTALRLRLTGDRGGLGLFLGLKIASGLVGLAIFPVAASIRIFPTTPSWVWLASAVAWFLMPDVLLRSKADSRLRQLREGLARFADLTSLSVSAGLGLEGAIDEVAATSVGPFFEELRRAVRDCRLNGEPASAAIGRLASELALPEAEPLAAALDTAGARGIPITQVLRTQARSIRERRRLELIEAGERAQVRMALPVGVLILPAFFILILYPAAVQLLQVTAR
jgi:Flp pilus assembly protein TadB